MEWSIASLLQHEFAVQGAGRAWIVYAVIALQSCLAPFFASAEAALVPGTSPLVANLRASAPAGSRC